MMSEAEKKAFDQRTIKLAEAYKKISRLTLGQEVPRRLQDILCSATFHLGIAMRQYKLMLSDPALDEQTRKKLEGQSNDCADLIGLFGFIHIPEKGEKI